MSRSGTEAMTTIRVTRLQAALTYMAMGQLPPAWQRVARTAADVTLASTAGLLVLASLALTCFVVGATI